MGHISHLWKRFNQNTHLHNAINLQNILKKKIIISFLRIEWFCLFVCGFSSHSRIFHSYGDTFSYQGLQILTYAQH